MDSDNIVKTKYVVDHIFVLGRDFYLNMEKDEDPEKIIEFTDNLTGYSISSKIITRKITFDFYLLYKAYIGGWEAIPGIANSDIRKWHDDQVLELTKFTREYTEQIDTELVLKESQ